MHARSHIVLIIAIALFATACSHVTNEEKAQADLAKAETEAQRTIIAAKAKFDQVMVQNNKDVANAQLTTPAGAAGGSATPETNARNDLAIAQARMAAAVSAADARYAVEKAEAEAKYNIAVARCESELGSAQKSCRDSARATFEGEISLARTKNALAHPHA